jgi:TctA family transporter
MLRTLFGLLVGLLLATVGVDALISINRRVGYFDRFDYEQAVLGLLLVVACVVAAQLSGIQSRRGKGE